MRGCPANGRGPSAICPSNLRSKGQPCDRPRTLARLIGQEAIFPFSVCHTCMDCGSYRGSGATRVLLASRQNLRRGHGMCCHFSAAWCINTGLRRHRLQNPIHTEFAQMAPTASPRSSTSSQSSDRDLSIDIVRDPGVCGEWQSRFCQDSETHVLSPSPLPPSPPARKC